MKPVLLLLVLVVAALATPVKRTQLGKPISLRPNPRVINGRDAEEGEFPYQLSYQWGLLGIWQHVCGASIVSPTWAVTAGHCVTEVPELGDHQVVAGITHLYETTAERQEIAVVDKIVHEGFGGDVGPNDIALLKLATALVFGDLVKPIGLPVAGSETTGEVVLTGWGSISTLDVPWMPEVLQVANLPLLTYDECDGAIVALLDPSEEDPLSQESNVCTGPLVGAVGACSGDSGGPLAQNGTLIGIVSWGFQPCGISGAPSVYTKASNFIDFISEHVTDLYA